MTPDKIQERALETWYTEGHSLRLDPLPCLFGLAGETGELVDLCKKDLYKTSFIVTREIWLDELGDVLYYLAIRCFQLGISVIDLCPYEGFTYSGDIPDLVIWMNKLAATVLSNHYLAYKIEHFIVGRGGEIEALTSIKARMVTICSILNISLDELSQLNYQKLTEREKNGEGYNRGEET